MCLGHINYKLLIYIMVISICNFILLQIQMNVKHTDAAMEATVPIPSAATSVPVLVDSKSLKMLKIVKVHLSTPFPSFL